MHGDYPACQFSCSLVCSQIQDSLKQDSRFDGFSLSSLNNFMAVDEEEMLLYLVQILRQYFIF